MSLDHLEFCADAVRRQARRVAAVDRALRLCRSDPEAVEILQRCREAEADHVRQSVVMIQRAVDAALEPPRRRKGRKRPRGCDGNVVPLRPAG